MKLGQKILEIFKRKDKTVRQTSAEIGVPKSTVHYHNLKASDRIQSLGTSFWETEYGMQFLTRLVVSSIFVFGLKSGNGASRFKEFFKHLGLEYYLPASESSILIIIRRIEFLILEYKKSNENQLFSRVKEIELILGVDETWFDKMYLVCLELSSGYVFFETESEHRDVQSWDKHIKKKLFSLLPNAKIKYFVSDRAKALVNLATVVHKVTSVADCFHFKYCINKLLCLALSSKLRCAKIDFNTAKLNQCPKNQIETSSENYAHIQFYTDLYVETMANISQVIHPFYQGNKTNTQERAEDEINSELSNIEKIIDDCQILDKYGLFSKAQQQVPDVTSVISLWNQMKEDKLEQLGLAGNNNKWFREYLLPKAYWETALKRTKYKPIRDKLKRELEIIEQQNKANKQVIKLSEKEEEELNQVALDLCRKFQRASSQVEGRNGFLSLINHNQRSFDNIRMEVLTILHNFDTRGIDKKTPVERLFGEDIQLTPIINFVMDNFGDLPRPRNRKLTG